MIGQTFPASAFFSDYAAKPKQMDGGGAEEGVLEELAKLMVQANQDLDEAALLRLLSTVEPFTRYPDQLKSMLKRISA